MNSDVALVTIRAVVNASDCRWPFLRKTSRRRGCRPTRFASAGAVGNGTTARLLHSTGRGVQLLPGALFTRTVRSFGMHAAGGIRTR